jgi:hypothetical protein
MAKQWDEVIIGIRCCATIAWDNISTRMTLRATMTSDHISTTTYAMWREHLWNISALQWVQLSSRVFIRLQFNCIIFNNNFSAQNINRPYTPKANFLLHFTWNIYRYAVYQPTTMAARSKVWVLAARELGSWDRIQLEARKSIWPRIAGGELRELYVVDWRRKPYSFIVHLSQDISELRWPLQIHTLAASQLRYGEGGEAIAHKASCSPLALSIFPSHYDAAQTRRYFASSILYVQSPLSSLFPSRDIIRCKHSQAPSNKFGNPWPDRMCACVYVCVCPLSYVFCYPA